MRAQSIGRKRDRMEVMNRVREPNAKQREDAEQREGAERGTRSVGEMENASRYSRKQAK